jgi:hypothetical protein
MKLYIKDTTISKEPKFFNTINEVVNHLEGAVQRKFRQTRKQYMQNLVDLGHGYDDPEGKNFTEALSRVFEIGLQKPHGLVRCNIHEASLHSKYRTESGD